MECPHCHEDAVVEDELDSEAQKVCQACGIVLDKNEFTVGESTAEGIEVNSHNLHANIPWEHRKELYRSKPPVVKFAIEQVKGLSKLWQLSGVSQSSSVELFERIIKLEEFKFARRETKHGLAACCVYITLRQNNTPVTKLEFCQTADVSITNFNDSLTKVLSLLNIQITTPAIEDVLPGYLRQYAQPDKEKVISKSLKLILLARKVWLTCSKKPQAVISACAYVAWVSLDVANRIGVKYNAFCSLHNLQKYSSSAKRVTELLEMLTKLAEQLPWVLKHQLKNKRYLFSSIDSILNTSNLLCHLAVGSQDEEEIRNSFVQPPPAKRFKSDVRRDPDLPEGSVSNSPELTKEDIPDDSLHLYIRSEQEMNDLQFFSYKHEC